MLPVLALRVVAVSNHTATFAYAAMQNTDAPDALAPTRAGTGRAKVAVCLGGPANVVSSSTGKTPAMMNTVV